MANAPRVSGNAQPQGGIRRRETGDAGDSLAPKDYSRPFGDMTIVASPPRPVSIVRPRDIYKVANTFVFRPLPTIDAELWNEALDAGKTPEKKPRAYRSSSLPGGISRFMRRYDVAQFGEGKNAFTFITGDPLDGNYEADMRDDPYRVLSSAVYKAAKNTGGRPAVKPHFAHLTDGSGNRPALLPKTRSMYMMLGLVYQNPDGKTSGIVDPRGLEPLGSLPTHPLQIIQLYGSAGEAAYAAFTAVNDDADPASRNWEQVMRGGDPVHPAAGRFVSIYNGEKFNSRWQDTPELRARSKTFIIEGQQNQAATSYSCRLDRELYLDGRPVPGVTARIPKDRWGVIWDKVVWMEDLVRRLSIDEMCLLIATALAPYREAIEYGWQDYPQYLTGEVRAKLANAVQTTNPGWQTHFSDSTAPAMSAAATGAPATAPPLTQAALADVEYAEYDEYDEADGPELTDEPDEVVEAEADVAPDEATGESAEGDSVEVVWDDEYQCFTDGENFYDEHGNEIVFEDEAVADEQVDAEVAAADDSAAADEADYDYDYEDESGESEEPDAADDVAVEQAAAAAETETTSSDDDPYSEYDDVEEETPEIPAAAAATSAAPAVAPAAPTANLSNAEMSPEEERAAEEAMKRAANRNRPTPAGPTAGNEPPQADSTPKKTVTPTAKKVVATKPAAASGRPTAAGPLSTPKTDAKTATVKTAKKKVAKSVKAAKKVVRTGKKAAKKAK